MSKNHNITYAVNEENTSVIMINQSDLVSDVLKKIQENENDKEYTHLFYDGTEIEQDEPFYDFFDPQMVYVASKTSNLSEYFFLSIANKLHKPQNFKVYTTLTLKSMLEGNIVEGIDINMKADKVKSVIHKWITNEKSFEKVLNDIPNFEVYLFLPGGVPFHSGTFEEWEHCLDTPVTKILYVVITRKLGSLANDICDYVCDCSNDEMKLLLSPLNDSTNEGYTQIASLLGYFYYGGSLQSCESILHNLAAMTGFAPMINSIYTIKSQKKVTGLMIASITAPLQTFIFEKVINIEPSKAFSYTISFMSYMSTNFQNIPVPNFITYNIKQDDDDDELNSAQVYLKNHCHQNFIALWDKDFVHDENEPFKFMELPVQVTVEKLNESIKSDMTFRPVSPMTIHYLNSVSYIRMQKTSSEPTTKVGLFIQAKPKEGNIRNVVFINPEEGGEPEEIDYEDLADHIRDHSIDENIENQGDVYLQQIIFFCVDTSMSMRNLINGRVKKVSSKEPSRNQLSIEFMKNIIDQIHDLKYPTAQGLILFGETIKIVCPLSVTEKNFDAAFEDIKLYGTTPLLDTINLAADEIIKFNPCKIVDGEKRYKYPEARGRIIVISDADDNESELGTEYAITEKLVQNNIVMDFVMVSSADECIRAITMAKITGGLSFSPKNKDEGAEIFSKEAFLDINARSNFKPIKCPINEQLFSKIKRQLGSNPYNKMDEI